MKYLVCTIQNCGKTLENVEYLQAHIIKKHQRFAHLEHLDDAVRMGDIKFSNVIPSEDKPRAKPPLRKACNKGHRFTKENTILAKQGRLCKTCATERYARQRMSKAVRESKL
jgi:hypothetical protein